MPYHTLRALHAQVDRAEYDDIRAERADGALTLKTGVVFQNDAAREELFLVEFPDLSVLQTQILDLDREIKSVMRRLPKIAYQKYIHELLIAELSSTNAIEGVRSTRKELDAALQAAKAPASTAPKRFREMARLYLGLEDYHPSFPTQVIDVRELYDALVGDEVKKSDQPDGEMFRADRVSIVDEHGQEIATGVTPETAIVDMLRQMIALSQSMWPKLYKAFAMHYIFEAIHPFYDGNGRLGRFLLAISLRDEHISLPSIFAFSHEITERRRKYYSAFTQVQHLLNHGELSFFVYELLKVFYEGQKGSFADLYAKEQALTIYEKYFTDSLSPSLAPLAALVAQASLFSTGEGITLDELTEAVAYPASKQTIRKRMSDLQEQGVIKRIGSRPLRFLLSDETRTKVERT